MRGWETLAMVESQIAALHQEKIGARDERHLAAIEAQLRIFEAERERMVVEGDDEGPEVPASVGTLAWTGGKWGAQWPGL